MAFQIIGAYPTPPQKVAVTSGQSVAVGDLVRLVSNRVRDATSGGSGDWLGLALQAGTGDAGGTVEVLVAPISASTQLRTAWATAALPGANLDLASGGAGVTTNSNGDFVVLSQSGGYVIVTALAKRISQEADSAKADKVTSAVNGNFAGLNASGNLTDSGSAASTFAVASKAADRLYYATGVGLAGAGDITITSKTSGVTPAIGDKIVGAVGFVTATGVHLAVADQPAIGTAFSATLGTAGVVSQLVGSLNANSYIFQILRQS